MKKSNRNILIKVIVTSVIIFFFFEMIFLSYLAYANQSESNSLYKKSYAIQSQIEKIFQSTITISDGYLSYVTSNIDVTKEESEWFLEHLLSNDDNYIHNIALVEDTTIIYNYPYEENMSSIGADLSTVEGQIEETLFVKNNLETLFFGPVELVQGGMAFLLVIPVLDGDEYFGQIVTVIDADVFMDTLQQEADIQNINVRILYNDMSEELLLLGENTDGVKVNTTYSNKYFTWNIEVSDKDVESILFIAIFSRLIAMLFIALIGYSSFHRKILRDEIKFNSVHDSLTKDYNRAKFISDYEESRFDNMLIAFADVNKFKLLNDTLGHLFGDWCLIQLSNKLNEFGPFRVYRISGDEFILVSTIPMTTSDFVDNFKSKKFVFYNEELKQDVDLDLSIGILDKLVDTIDLETILMYLDYAMYDAKKDNKMFTIVNSELMTKYDEIKVIEQQLIDDVKKNRLLPYYQPIINLETGEIDGFEVLSRWFYKGEIRSAAMFINIVKKVKYVDLVDRNLFNALQEDYIELKEQCKQITDMTFSINLSAETLMIMEKDNAKFNRFVQERKIPISKIIFEISEDMNLGLISIETLRYMQEKGYNITVDDFGAGVSRLSDVLSGELKRIKTDKSLLPSRKENDKKIAGFYTIIKAIKTSGSVICVEGVETPSQLDMSIEAGCKLAQGYLFGKPMPKDQVVDFIKNFDYSKYELKK